MFRLTPGSPVIFQTRLFSTRALCLLATLAAIDAVSPMAAARSVGANLGRSGPISAGTHAPSELGAEDSGILHLAAKEPSERSRPTSHRSAQSKTSRPQTESTQARLNRVTEENRALKAELATLTANQHRSGPTAEELAARVQELNTELMAIRQTAANALRVQAERDHLHESVIKLERELESVKRGKQSLEADSRQDWFLVGAGVLLAGLILGMIIPQLGWRKRSHWDSF
jgi:SH3 domain protein